MPKHSSPGIRLVRKRLEPVREADPAEALAEVIAVAAELGYSFDGPDYEAALEAHVESRELGEDELANVAGGLWHCVPPPGPPGRHGSNC